MKQFNVSLPWNYFNLFYSRLPRQFVVQRPKDFIYGF